MKRWAKSAMGRALFAARSHPLFLRESAVIVAFHRVTDRTIGDGLTCGLEEFDRFCQFFAEYFHVVPLRNLVEKMERGASLGRELVITFDDGYRDNYENAAPMLKKLGLPATFFVVTDFIGTEIVPWWDREPRSKHAWMTWDEVRCLAREGFEIGGHTRSHADLGEVSGKEAWEEILGSRIDLENELSKAVEMFAFPYGREKHMTEENRNIVRATGFRCCCSCYGGINDAETDPFHLRRIPIVSWYASPYQFGFELAVRRA